MALHDRSHDPSPDARHPMPSTWMSLLLAAAAAIVLVLGIYFVTHLVGPGAYDLSSVVQTVTPQPATGR